MKKAVQFLGLLEAIETSDSDKLAKEVRNVIKKYFPNSGISVKHETKFFNLIKIAFSLNRSTNKKGLVPDDPYFTVFGISGMDNYGSFGDRLTVKKYHSEKGVDTPEFSQFTGNAKSVLAQIDNYFSKLADIVKRKEH